MRAVMLDVPESTLEERRRWGADTQDEIWDGELHMVPPATVGHQSFSGDIEAWGKLHWAWPAGHLVARDVAVCLPGDWRKNYRVPDVVFLLKEHLHLNLDTHIAGPPDVAVEIHSPGDEAYEKLPFYAALGVPEVWIIHRDTRVPELYRLDDGEYILAEPDADGWLRSNVTGIELRPADDNRLALRLDGDEATRDVLPRH